MVASLKVNTVNFGTKGQVVIPLRLRKEFEIAVGILIKPITAASIRKLRGILKRKLGDKSFAEEMAEYKREEIQQEEAKYARSTGS